MQIRMEPAKPYDVILRVGAAGGSLALLGNRLIDGTWLFVRERDESFHEELLAMEDRQGLEFRDLSGVVSTFEAALGLLADYQWHRLYPVHVHPEFRQAVFEAVENRTKLRGGRNDNLYEWKHLCGIESV